MELHMITHKLKELIMNW